MRISDWSSDVCSSDLVAGSVVAGAVGAGGGAAGTSRRCSGRPPTMCRPAQIRQDRTSHVEGKCVFVRVDLGGSRFTQKKNTAHIIAPKSITLVLLTIPS